MNKIINKTLLTIALAISLTMMTVSLNASKGVFFTFSVLTGIIFALTIINWK